MKHCASEGVALESTCDFNLALVIVVVLLCSMMGEKEDRGVIPRFGEELFERITQDETPDVSVNYFCGF